MKLKLNFGVVTAFTPLAFTIVLYMISFQLDAREQQLALGSNAFVAIQDGRLSFFSDAQYGPYRGSIISLSDGVHPPDYEQSGFDLPGLYYRWFCFKTGPFWTLTISLVFPIGLGAIMVGLWLFRRSAANVASRQRLKHGPNPVGS